MSDEHAPVVAVDIGGTGTTVALVRGRDVSDPRTVPTPARGADVVDTVVDLVRALRDATHAAATPVRAVGIGSAGVVDPVTGDITHATDHIADWTGTPLRRLVAERTGLPTVVVNDVHAHAVGEALHGSGQGRRHLLVVAAGTGLGGALVVDGAVVTGAHGAAGHLGHVPCAEAAGMTCACGGTGHLECVASGPGLVALARLLGVETERAEVVVARADAGDPLAQEAVRTSGAALGAAVGGWVNTLDPEVVVVTGGLAGAGPAWWQALRDAAAAEMVPAVRGCAILPARLGAGAALVGAAAMT